LADTEESLAKSDLAVGGIPGAGLLYEHAIRYEKDSSIAENGALVATQFHPEKSGDAGAQLLANWVRSLR